MLSLAAGCQNSPAEEGASPPAANAAARNPASPPADGGTPPPEAPSPPPSGTADPSPAADDAGPPPAPPPAAPPAAAAGPYLAVARGGPAVPDALGSGRFSVRDGCVVYRPDGSSDVFTPVFPAGTRLVRAPDGLSVGGRRVEFGRSYRVSGGEVPPSALADARPVSPVPDRCPARRFLVGSVAASP